MQAIEGLTVDFELHTNPDGSYTVHFRHGLPFGHQAAAMINELAVHRDEHCPICTAVLLKSASHSPGSDADLADLIRKAVHHNWHLTHGPERVVRQRTDSPDVERRVC
ncbi:hypothetical protein [Lentzea sp. NBRC 102530]|uniref:hypothetical protein n=1 Tax=Lentzea sp. NBRC 102530 TaxID=3032201 RepID=UPI002554F941|nr:hypothetical protein [Lentzea sp. NBRC 102530]